MIIIGLATFAITYVLRYTSGPFDVFERLREWAGITSVPVYNEGMEVVYIVEEIGDTYISKLYSCVWCTGTWVALALTLHYMPDEWFLTWFAALGVAGILHEIINGKNNQ